ERCRVQRRIVCEYLQLTGQIDLVDTDGVRGVERGGGEIENAAHTRLDGRAGRRGCRRCGNGHDHQVDVLVPGGQVVESGDGQRADRRPDLLLVDVEDGGQTQAPTTEAGIVGQGRTEATGADDGHAPVAVEAEEAPQGGDEFGARVSDAALAGASQLGQVLAQ